MTGGGRAPEAGERPFGNLVDFASTNDRLRFARITDVDTDKGVVGISWLDHPGGRVEVILSQPAWGFYTVPVAGSIVACGFDTVDRTTILRYIPIAYKARHGDPSEGAFEPQDALREVKEGEHFLKSIAGAEVYMDVNGNIVLSSGAGSYWKITLEDLIQQNSETWKVQNEAGTLTMGIVRRLYEDTDFTPVQVDNRIIKNGSDEAYVEYRLRVAETADASVGTASTPDLVELTIGTLVDDDGNVVESANGANVTIDLNTKSDIGFRFQVDRDGNVDMTIKDGKTFTINANDFNINSDDVTISGGGLTDQVVLSDFIDDHNNFVSDFNQHGHVSAAPGVSTGPPSVIPSLVPIVVTPANKDNRSSDNFETE